MCSAYGRTLLRAAERSGLQYLRRNVGVCWLFDDVTEMISRHTSSLTRVEPPVGRVMSLPRDSSANVGCARVTPS
jgi:hypothetical protein